MDEELKQKQIEMTNKIEQLKKERKEIQNKIKNGNLLDKRKNEKKDSYGENGNELMRVSKLFSKKLRDIDDKRLGIGLDKISHPKKTELIVRHKNWVSEEKDIIYFNTNIKEDEK